MIRQTACLLLLTCLAGILASEREQDVALKDTRPSGPSSMAIIGVNIVTVGVPYAFMCSASCNPACTFSWTRGSQTSKGAELTLQLKAPSPQEVVTCVAINPATGRTATISRTLAVTMGPSNIRISGPPLLTVGVENTFTCTADCYPSCTFSWKWKWSNVVLGTSSGDTLSIKPSGTVEAETVFCEAMDTVSHLYISTSLLRYVSNAIQLKDIQIVASSGLWTVTVGHSYMFLCLVECTPSCTVTWTFEGKTHDSNQIYLPIFHKGGKSMTESEQEISITTYHRTEPLTCEAKNTASGATISATRILTIINPYFVRPASQGEPIAGQPFSLQCIGSENPASLTWHKNSLPLPVSDRVFLSLYNTLLTFLHLMESDTGTYQCVVDEGKGPINSIGYEMQVNYGPFKVEIVEVNKGPVGKELTALPGSITALQCVADCYPGCSITWFYNGKMLSKNASISFTPVTPPNRAVLRCVAYDSLTMKNSSAETAVVVPYGPFKVEIVEVNKGPVGKELTALPGSITALQCVADCYPGCSITWFYSGKMLSKNASISFTPVTPPNQAVLRCVAYDSLTMKNSSAETTVIVPYGPFKVEIVEVNKGPVDKELTALPGSITALQCVADCYPGCSITWFYNGKMLSKNASISFTPVTPPNQAVLRCVAYDSLTMKNSSAETTVVVPYGPFKVEIVEVNKGPVGKELTALPGSITALQCVADCYPGCSITWFYNGKMLSKNASISFTPVTPPNQAVLSCVAFNSLTMKNSSAETTVIVPYGPFKVEIVEVNKGPVGKELTALPGSITALQCVADCYPGCSITWFYNGKMLSKNASISFTPVTPPNQAVLRCVAYDSLTMKNSSAETTVVVPYGPFKVEIVKVNKGPIGKELTALPGSITALQCVADCYPGCSITWFYNGKMLSKNASISFTPVTPPNQAVLSCVAFNSLTMKNSSAETTVIVPYGPFKVEIVEVNKGPVGKELTALPGSITALQCVADCYPGCSITWFYSGKMLSKNPSVSFTPVTPPNQAVLRCVAYDSLTMKNSSAETTVIVPYGPFKVEIVEAKYGPVGKELTALPGSITALQCVADCYPGCSITWFYNGKMLSKNASISFTPVTPPNQAVLRCVAFNSLTMKNSSAETTVIVPYGPVNVTISGPHSLEVGVKATFTCNAACVPPCTYTWHLYGSPVKGSAIDITINRYVSTESISCEAHNGVSGKTATVSDTLTISDPHWCGC